MDTVLLVLEYLGVIAFAVSGSMVAIDKEADYVGVLLLSLVTCFGGGIMRDIFLGQTPPRFFTQYQSEIIISLVTSVIVIVFATIFKRAFVHYEHSIEAINNIVDAIGLGAFTVGGSFIALECGFTSAHIVISMGLISSIGGGLMRDLILRDIPFIIRKRVYALASFLGASLYYILAVALNVDNLMASIAGVFMTFSLRIMATVFKWNIPKAIDFDKLDAEISAKNDESDVPCNKEKR